jgi:hypothetical protein
MGGMFGRKKRRHNKSNDTYTVLMNVGGTPYYMNWPATDIDPDSSTFGMRLSTNEVQDWVWEWVHQETNDRDILKIGKGHESRSIRASAIMHIDVVTPRFLIT